MITKQLIDNLIQPTLQSIAELELSHGYSKEMVIDQIEVKYGQKMAQSVKKQIH